MKYIIILLCSCLFLYGCDDKKDNQVNEASKKIALESDMSTALNDNKIYFFTKDMCPYCNQAAAFISLNYPNLQIEFKDISQKENWDLMLDCVNKFHLNKRSIGTPLICMGSNYVLGWGPQNAEKFKQYVKPFVK